MNLFTVILHYGAVELTMRLHRQLLASDPGERDRILVFDNSAEQPYPQAWVRSDRNLYWAGAFESAVETLAAKGVTHVWFLNNDLEFMTRPPVIGRVRERLASLTPRERDVLLPLVQGYTNREIAEQLGVSIKTVDLYRSRVMKRMQAERLSDLVGMACVLGLIDPLAPRAPGQSSTAQPQLAQA